MMCIRVCVFIVLSDVLELFLADGTVKWPKDLRYLSLKSGATGDISLRYTNDKLQNLCREGQSTHLPSLSLFLSFVPLAFRVQFTSLRDRSLNHTKILTGLPEPGCIILDVERDGINPSCADLYSQGRVIEGRKHTILRKSEGLSLHPA
jgi:hypothetical protein